MAVGVAVCVALVDESVVVATQPWSVVVVMVEGICEKVEQVFRQKLQKASRWCHR